ncbi:MAG: cyclic nucleotide-binding domain-containing protein [Methylacidiphilales bacterium]|nr:cyclic nucleotide-binding domain-containing protein [Candidatus Methylacidiphilales bacterium]
MISPTPVPLEALVATPVLAGLSPEALNLLMSEGIVHDFRADEVVVREGESGHSFYILVEGDVEVIKNLESPHSVTLATLRAHNFFGEMCVIDPVPRAATVYAITPVRAIEIKSATLHHLFKRMPDQYAIVLLNISRDLIRRLRSIDEIYAARAS